VVTVEVKPVLMVIPARGGSKGIPDKNLREVGGLPLIARTIRTALAVGSDHSVVVSTDCDRIAQIAQAEGACVLERPTSISGDTASSESAVLDVLEQLGTQSSGGIPTRTLMLQCTSPFTLSSDITKVIEVLDSFDSVFTATSDITFKWNVNEQREAQPIGHNIREARSRRQELHGLVRESGAVYGFHTEKFQEEGRRFFGRIGVVEVPEERALEIDSHHDLKIAQLVAGWLD